MQHLPLYIAIVMILCTAYTFFLGWRAAGRPVSIIMIFLAWLALQGILAATGFYLDANDLPPRFALALFPPLIAIIVLFSSRKGRAFIDRLQLPDLALLHLVRIPVEMVLLWLSIYKAVPGIITFEGQNFDIISGITAPFAWYFIKRNTNRWLLIGWNIMCLALLCNVVITAVLAAPFRFQQLAFDQPTIAVLYFPYIWLPAFIVPMVLFSHIVSIRRLVREPGRPRVKVAGS